MSNAATAQPVLLRDYQRDAIERVHAAWEQGARSVCLVAPTGSGKTTIGSAIASRFPRVLWIAHRRELVTQAAQRLSVITDSDVAPLKGEDAPDAPIQVATIQTLLARTSVAPADLVVGDEVHHYVSDEWRKLAQIQSNARILGLTATPERGDGRPLGDICDALVQAVSYSELLSAGHLVPCRIFQPSKRLVGQLAQAPLGAYIRYVPGQLAFVFCSSIEDAERTAWQFNGAGFPAAAITSKTPKKKRDEYVEAFRRGDIRVLTNVNTLTEGVDVPMATAVILARSCEHTGTYLQIAGRILRPCPGKHHATLIDLTGASLNHGFPTDDRSYALDGAAIRRETVPALSTCLSCGAVYRSGPTTCPMCGVVQPRPAKAKSPRIAGVELREACKLTPEEKEELLCKLLAQREARGSSFEQVTVLYRQQTGEYPDLSVGVSEDERDEELAHLRAKAARLRRSERWVRARQSQIFRKPQKENH